MLGRRRIFKADVAVLCKVVERQADVAYILRHVNRLRMQRLGSYVEAAEVEQHVDLIEQQARILVNHLQTFPQRRLAVILAHLLNHALQRTDDERQRRAQVVAYVGKEAQLHLRELCLLALLHEQTLLLNPPAVA